MNAHNNKKINAGKHKKPKKRKKERINKASIRLLVIKSDNI